MTNEQFIHWLKGFVDYQQLQEQKNPAFNTIKAELEKLDSTNNASVKLYNTPGGGTTVTYKTDSPITYTTC